jgi:uroporphyrinogen-III synthase
VELISPVLYETVERGFDTTVVNRVDVVAVSSPSAIRAVGVVALPVASIGPTTSAAIRRLGMEPWVEAPAPSFESLAQAIRDKVGKRLE